MTVLARTNSNLSVRLKDQTAVNFKTKILFHEVSYQK
jgi:hypothetical protein